MDLTKQPDFSHLMDDDDVDDEFPPPRDTIHDNDDNTDGANNTQHPCKYIQLLL